MKFGPHENFLLYSTLPRYSLIHSTDVLGHPFGKVPSPRPFEADPVESQVILSDPCGPVGKELLAGKHERYWWAY